MALPPAAAGPTERLIGYLVGNGAAADEQEVLLRGELAALEAQRGIPGAIVVRCEPLLEEDWGAGWAPATAAPRTGTFRSCGWR